MESNLKRCPGNDSCPVREDARRAVALSKDLSATMRRLRRNLRACERCTWQDDCWLRHNFNSLIDAAIAEVSEQWSQGRSDR